MLFPEGKNTAKQYACKYIEVSATIDHQIDELFVGILKQIRLIASCSSSNKAAINSSAYPNLQLIDADDADEDVASTSCLCSGRSKQHSPSQERRYDAASASVGSSGGGGNASGGVELAGADRNSQRHWTLQDTCCLLRARDNALSRMLMKGMGRGSRSCSNLYVL